MLCLDLKTLFVGIVLSMKKNTKKIATRFLSQGNKQQLLIESIHTQKACLYYKISVGYLSVSTYMLCTGSSFCRMHELYELSYRIKF